LESGPGLPSHPSLRGLVNEYWSKGGNALWLGEKWRVLRSSSSSLRPGLQVCCPLGQRCWMLTRDGHPAGGLYASLNGCKNPRRLIVAVRRYAAIQWALRPMCKSSPCFSQACSRFGYLCCATLEPTPVYVGVWSVQTPYFHFVYKK